MTHIHPKIVAAMPVKDSERAGYLPTRVNGSFEYPLFTEAAKNDCPTARYVGGVSRWLCECSDPLKCQGVRRAQLAADGVTITRREMMANSSELHWAYHEQCVTGGTIADVIMYIGIRPILQSTDPYFNDIPLKLWDKIGLTGKAASLIALAETFTYAPGTRPQLSLATQVCTLKAAARIIKRSGLEFVSIGTHHFYDINAVKRYYADYGFTESDIQEKINCGEVAIGRPEVEPGQKAIRDNQGRFKIEYFK